MREFLPLLYLPSVWHSVWQNGETALALAIRLNKIAFMKKLIEAGAKVDYRNKVCSDTFGANKWGSHFAGKLYRPFLRPYHAHTLDVRNRHNSCRTNSRTNMHKYSLLIVGKVQSVVCKLSEAICPRRFEFLSMFRQGYVMRY